MKQKLTIKAPNNNSRTYVYPTFNDGWNNYTEVSKGTEDLRNAISQLELGDTEKRTASNSRINFLVRSMWFILQERPYIRPQNTFQYV